MQLPQPPQVPRQITAEDSQTGRQITFMWEGAEPPTEQDMAEIFAAAGTATSGPGGFVPTAASIPEPPVGGTPASQAAQGFARGAGNNVGQSLTLPFQGYKNLWDFARAIGTSPLRAAQDIVRGSDSMLSTETGFPAMVMPNIERLGEGFRAARFGRPVEAVGNMLAGAVPFAGPFVADQVETALDAEAPPSERGRAAGEIAGTVGQTLLPSAIRRARTPSAPEVPMTFGERARGPVGAGSRFLESIFERTPVGAPLFAPLRGKQTGALIRMADELAGDIAKNAGDDVVASSRRAFDGMAQAEKLMEEQATAIYSTIDEATQGLSISTRGVKARAEPLWDRIVNESELVDPTELTRAQSQLRRVLDAPETVSYRTVADARSTMLKLSRTAQEPRVSGVAKLLAEELDSMMINGAEASGVAGLPEMIRQANSLVRERYEIFSNRFIKRLADSSPEQLPEIVSRGSSDQARLAIRAAGPRANDLRQAYGRHLIDRVVTGEAVEATGSGIAQRIGGLAENVAVESRGINGRALSNLIERQSRSGVLEAIYGKQGAADWESLGQSVMRLQGKVGGGFPALAAGALNVRLGTPILSALGIFPGAGLAALPGTLKTAGGIFALSWVMTRGPARRPLIQLVKAMEEGNVPQAAFWGSRLDQALEANQRDLPPQAGVIPAEQRNR